jgi:hypothetical protein
VERTFTVADARALMPELLTHADALVEQRADLAELNAALQAGDPSPLGGRAELKALEARVSESIGWFEAQGLQVKGVAPLLVDFPSTLDGTPVLLCWLEGDRELGWYHRTDLGFLGRRRLPS